MTDWEKRVKEAELCNHGMLMAFVMNEGEPPRFKTLNPHTENHQKRPSQFGKNQITPRSFEL